MTLPSDTIIDEFNRLLTDQTRKNFLEKYGAETDYVDANGNIIQGLSPDEMFLALGEQMINPSALQDTTQSMMDYDRTFARGGGYRSRGLQAKRAAYLKNLDTQRQEKINQFIESQKDFFNKWYTQEMYKYQTSKVPSQYTLGKFGITNPGGTAQEYTVGPNQQKFAYKTPYNSQSIFKYGGYTRPEKLYSTPTPI